MIQDNYPHFNVWGNNGLVKTNRVWLAEENVKSGQKLTSKPIRSEIQSNFQIISQKISHFGSDLASTSAAASSHLKGQHNCFFFSSVNVKKLHLQRHAAKIQDDEKALICWRRRKNYVNEYSASFPYSSIFTHHIQKQWVSELGP